MFRLSYDRMMKQRLLILFALTALLLASWFTFFAPDRYGTHGDSLQCGQNAKHKTSLTVSTYLLFTQSNNENNVDIGTCPYQKFTVRTYSLEIWILAAVLGLLAYRSIRTKTPLR